MKKKITYSLSLLLMLLLSGGVSAQSISVSGGERRERPAREVQAKHIAKAPAMATADGTLLYGCLTFDSYSYFTANAIYSFAQAGTGLTKVKDGVNANGGGAYARGKYYAISFTDGGMTPSNMKLNIYDVKEDWAQVGVNISMSYMASDLTYDPATDQIYGAFTNDFNTYYLGTMNKETGSVTTIAALPGRMSGLAANKDGDLYGIGFSDWKLYYINKSNAQCTEVGEIKDPYTFDLFGFQTATFDMETGNLYWFAGDHYEYGELYEITIEGSGASSQLVGSTITASYGPNGEYTSESFSGMFTMQEVTAATAPESAYNLEANFEDGSLWGEVKFTMPGKDVEGNVLSGELDYMLQVGDMAPITGKGEAGLQVTQEVEVVQSGTYLITVTVSSNGAVGIPATLNVWIGMDAPQAVSNLNLTASGNTTALSWLAPTEGQHGGYVGDFSYKVVRYPDGVEVANGLRTNRFSETIASDERLEYWYEVTAYCGDMEGETASSNKVFVGSVMTPPYHETFTSESSMDGFTIIDSNKDGSTWYYDSYFGPCYESNYVNDANDWIITPGLTLKPGNLYKVSFILTSNKAETFRAAFGNAATAEAMTTELVPATTINGNYRDKVFEYSKTVQVDQSGTYYFGIQAISVVGSTFLILEDIKVTVVSGTAPAPAENFTVTPGERGALKATLKFNAPTKRINGSTLSSLSSLSIYRNNEEIKAYNTVTPGQAITFEDSNVTNGLQKYTVVAKNEDGEGADNTITKFIGEDAPGAIRNYKIVEDLDKPGEFIATWDAPSEVGQNGGYVDASSLTYYIMDALNGDMSLGNATSFTGSVDVSRGQEIVGYTLYAVGPGGSGKNVRSTYSVAVGPALELPMVESFPGVSQASGPWLSEILAGETMDAWWDLTSGENLESGTYDNDGGVLFFSVHKQGVSSRIRTPKVDIRGSKNPTLVFYVYMTGEANKFDVAVSKEYSEYENILSFDLNSKPKGWYRYELPLTDYLDSRFIQVGFAAHAIASIDHVVSIDNISIRDQISNDLSVTIASAPRDIAVGSEGEFSLLVKNNGTEDVAGSDYQVEFYKNGNWVKTVDGKNVAGDFGTATIQVTDTPTINDPEATVYFAKVKYAADANADNDESREVSVRIELPVYPAVTDLRAYNAMTSVELRWSEPNVNNMPASEITDNVESYKSFAIDNIGDWRVYDGDGARTLRFSIDGVTDLDYDHAGEPMAFQVFSPYEAGIILNSWTPFSGDKMFVSIACSRASSDSATPQNNDWLISPELNGREQTISFFAKGASSSTIQSFEVRYSTTTADVASFTAEQSVALSTTAGVSGWEEFRVALPEGAKYFAIHYISTGQLAFMVDDITYTPAGAVVEDVMLMGYNVYRDGEKLNGDLLGESSYSDEDVVEGSSYSYKITAVYDKGESVYSNECVIVFAPSSIDNEEIRQVRVIGEQNAIVVKGAEGMPVQVYSAAGTMLYQVYGEELTTFSVESGLYIVAVNGKAVKVLVK